MLKRFSLGRTMATYISYPRFVHSAPFTVTNLLCITFLCLVFSHAASAQTPTFTQAQVDTGKALYKETCQICHGSSLTNGQFGTPLRGSFFNDKWQGKSLAELVAFVYEKMPPDNLKSLLPEQYIGAVAYILSRNDIAVSETEMSADMAALKSVMLPW